MSTPPAQQSHPLAESDIHAIRAWFAQTAGGFLSLGVYVTFSVVAICLSLARGISKSKIILFLTSFMLLSSIIYTILNNMFIILQIPENGFNPPEADQIPLTLRIECAGTFLNRLTFAINDGIVAWRAWVLFPQDITIKIVLIVFVIGSCVGALVQGTLVILQKLGDDPVALQPKAQFLILFLPLLLTNLVATALIGYKAWAYIKNIRNNLKMTGGSVSKAQKILLLLIESGIIYIVLWAVYCVLEFSSDPTSFYVQMYSSAMPNISGLYPVLIILIATLEIAQPTDLNETSLSQSIRFASARQPNSEAETYFIGTGN